MYGHLPVLQALLLDPRVNPGEKDKVREQWATDAEAAQGTLKIAGNETCVLRLRDGGLPGCI